MLIDRRPIDKMSVVVALERTVIMRCVLVNSPWSKPGFYGVRAGSRWPHLEVQESRYMPFPFFLAYAAAVLEQNGVFPRIIDGIAERLTTETFLYKIQKSQPDLLVMEVSTPSFPADLKMVERIRKGLGYDGKIAFCGPNHLMTGADFLADFPDVDYVFRGEYEYILLELVKALETGRPLSAIKGLNYRDDTGAPQINPERDLLQKIDELPWPSRHQLPMMNYFDEAGGIAQPSAQMWASRGCPYMCIFCLWPQLIYGGANYRVRNPVDVADEMAWLVETYDYKSVYFDDDTFNIGKNRMIKLCDEIKKRDLKIPWAIMARADGMDREILEKMKAAGLFSVKYGVESGDQKIVDASGKNLDLKTAREIITITRDLGIQFHLTFTFGLPGETRETARKTIDLALELNPTTAQFSVCTPMPGSKYYDMAREKGFLLDDDWTHYTGFDSAVIRTEDLSSDDLEEILADAQTKWFSHVAIRDGKQAPAKRKRIWHRVLDALAPHE